MHYIFLMFAIQSDVIVSGSAIDIELRTRSINFIIPCST